MPEHDRREPILHDVMENRKIDSDSTTMHAERKLNNCGDK